MSCAAADKCETEYSPYHCSLKMGNKGRVYFSLRGNFDPEEITRKVGIQPSEMWRAHEKDSLRKIPTASSWDYSSAPKEGEIVDVYGLSQDLADSLVSKRDIFKGIILDEGITGVLQVVLHISMDESISMPSIGFDRGVIDFVSYVGAFIDIDTYRH